MAFHSSSPGRRGPGLLLALCLAVSACGDSGAGTETAGTGASSTQGAGDICYDESVNFTYDEPMSLDVIACGFESPCATIEYAKEGQCENSPAYDAVAGACVVDALASGALAQHQLVECPGGTYTRTVTLQSFGDGTVLFHEDANADLNGSERATWRALPDASYFDACDTATGEGFVACVEGLLDQECQLGPPSCEQG